MPILAPQAAANYDTISTVIDMARVRLNDSIVARLTSGKILDNNNLFSQTLVNSAWRKTQDYLAEKGYDRLTDECIIKQFPIVASLDPASQCWINWQGCFDGQNFSQQPALPQFFNHPLKIWERWSNQNAEFCDPPMQKYLGGLPASQKSTKNRFWEWRSDTLYVPGCQMLTDLRIRHISYIADFLDVGNVPWFQQVVPIMRGSDGLAWMICSEVAISRGDNQAAVLFTTNGKEALTRIFNLDVEADQSVNIRRQPRTGIGFGRRWY